VKRIKVIYAKLGRSKAWGQAHSDGLVEIDIRAKGKKRLELIIHECLHLLYPDATEEEIISKSIALTKTLWHENYRQIDNDSSIPLQNSSK
jgi:hypothetical protein